MPIDDVLMESEEQMEKAISHLQHDLRGIRTGRPSPALIEYVKVDYYGSPTDLKSIAAISVDGNQLVAKPFNPGDTAACLRGLNDANLGVNPQSDGKVIRISMPSMSMDRRKQLVAQVKDAGEQAKIKIRNARRDGNKAVDAEEKDGSMGEDEAARGKESVQELLKQYEEKVGELAKKKEEDVMEV